MEIAAASEILTTLLALFKRHWIHLQLLHCKKKDQVIITEMCFHRRVRIFAIGASIDCKCLAMADVRVMAEVMHDCMWVTLQP